jgi:succinate dehydrogenase / fumarate reductase, cytochrome b subunit
MTASTSTSSTSSARFFDRYEFLIRRLHSLSGLIPVGAYMVVHLLVNASLLNGPGTFQVNVNQIHSLGKLLPVVEWTFIFLPIIFHAVVGVWIITTGKSNASVYKYAANWRYSLQRWSGVIAIFFIFFHVFHLHGWLHADWWKVNVAQPLGMGQFRPYNAASSLAMAMSGFAWPIFYFVGITASVFHLANGIWTMGITWGVWITPKAQKNASKVCAVGGLLLFFVGMSALAGVLTTDVEAAKKIEDSMYESKVSTGEIVPTPHKRLKDAGSSEGVAPEGGDSEAKEESRQ